MGLSAEAIIGHSVRADQLDDLPLRFASARAPRLARATSALEALTAPRKPVTGWTISPEEPLAVPLATAWDHDQLPTLDGPGIVYGAMARYTLTIGSGLRWMRPLSENPLFLAAHEVAAALAAALDSPLVLWIDDASLPKYMAWDGHTLDAILAWLAANAQPSEADPRGAGMGEPDIRYSGPDYHGCWVYRRPAEGW